jgi:hypothetical protein
MNGEIQRCAGGIRIAIGYTLRAHLPARTKEKLA